MPEPVDIIVIDSSIPSVVVQNDSINIDINNSIALSNYVAKVESGQYYSIYNVNNYCNSGNLSGASGVLQNQLNSISGIAFVQLTGITISGSNALVDLVKITGINNNISISGNTIVISGNDLSNYAELSSSNIFSGSNSFYSSIQITNNGAVGGTLILHVPAGSPAVPNHSKIRAGYTTQPRTLTTPDKDGLIAVISDLSGYYLSGNGELLSGNLFQTGANLFINDTILSGKLISLSGDITRKYSTYIGNGISTGIVVSHGLNTDDIIWSCRATGLSGNYDFVYPTVFNSGVGNLVFGFASGFTPQTNEYKVVVIG
jgi:hypothetical protein